MNSRTPDRSLDEIIDLLEVVEQQRRRADAERVRWFAAALEQALEDNVGSPEIAYRSLRAELATALQVSEHAIERQLSLAQRATQNFPSTLAALEQGTVSYQHVQVICDEGVIIGSGTDPETAERRHAYEQAVLEVAACETPNRLKPVARRLAETWAETPIEERHQEARTLRHVKVIDGDDGMADLIAHLPAVEAYAIRDRLTRISCHIERSEHTAATESVSAVSDAAASTLPPAFGASPAPNAPDASDALGATPESPVPSRTRDQIRADVLTELLLATDLHTLFAGSATEAIQARVQIMVPADTEQGTAELAGYGPIGTGTARNLAGTAPHWEHITTDPATGSVLAVDRYRPSEEMRRLLGARDQHCRFPGCRIPANRCDIDHTIDAHYGGPTATDNLANLCRGHHTLKHNSKWRVTQRAGGVLEWTSPTGREYTDRPPSTYRLPGTYRPPGTYGNPGTLDGTQHSRTPGKPSRVRFTPNPASSTAEF